MGPRAGLPSARPARPGGTHLPQLSLHHSPVGPLTLTEEDGAIVALDWGIGRDQQETALLREARRQLVDYFDGERPAFDLPLAASGSPYRRRVWAALRTIPYGETWSYARLASVAGGSARSVGQANGANPIPVIVPCHRVVGASGIGGYSGGDGLDTKRVLLVLEGALPPPDDDWTAPRSTGAASMTGRVA